MSDLIKLLRPSHWSKNIFVFAALIFSQKLCAGCKESVIASLSSLYAFICFCLASSAIYIFNDIIDRKIDQSHPIKKNRPIASGAVSVQKAAVLSIICFFAAAIGSFLLLPQFGFIILLYVFLNVLYSLKLRNTLILDVIIIAIGFVLRAVSGAVAIGVEISPWLIICTFALCLFLGFGKRRSEITMLKDDSANFRSTLGLYTPELLVHMLTVSSTLAVLSFLLYAMDDLTISRFGNNHLVWTTPMVLYCIFRFSALIQKGIYAGPVELIIKDKPFQVFFILWVIACLFIIYGKNLNLDFSIVY